MSAVSVPPILARAKELVSPALRAAVAGLSTELRPIAEYHLGWRNESGAPTGADGGKGVRPALAVLSAEAVGASAIVGVPGAVAVELVHDFSLIHDDVMDNDAERRHRPTVWALYGIGQAVIVGDALLVLADQVVLGVGLEAGARAARLLSRATGEMIAGQALDMAFESRRVVTLEECLAMEAGKTGALLGCAAAIGAILADAPAETIECLTRFGVEMGLSFQAVDDLLGIWGDPEATGKPAGSDLRQHKKSLPVVAALQEGGNAAEELSTLLEKEDLLESEVARAATLVEQGGGRELAQSEAHVHFEQALAALERAAITESSKLELIDLANFIVDRKF